MEGGGQSETKTCAATESGQQGTKIFTLIRPNEVEHNRSRTHLGSHA